MKTLDEGDEFKKARRDGFVHTFGIAKYVYLADFEKLEAKIQRMKEIITEEDLACADCVEAKADGYTICGDCSCE